MSDLIITTLEIQPGKSLRLTAPEAGYVPWGSPHVVTINDHVYFVQSWRLERLPERDPAPRRKQAPKTPDVPSLAEQKGRFGSSDEPKPSKWTD